MIGMVYSSAENGWCDTLWDQIKGYFVFWYESTEYEIKYLTCKIKQNFIWII
jgi:hypothetical protein